MRHGRRAVVWTVLVLVLAGAIQAATADQTYTFTGTIGTKGPKWVDLPFDVPHASILAITLGTTDPSVDVTLSIDDPNGQVVASTRASTLGAGTLEVDASTAGTWTAQLRAKRSGVGYTLRVDVRDPNHAPVARDDHVTTSAGTKVVVPVLDNDSDPDGNAIGLISVDAPAHGAASITTGGSVAYVPDDGYTGTDPFSYKICDDGVPSLCATATAFVDVQAASDPSPPPPTSSSSPPPSSPPPSTPPPSDGPQGIFTRGGIAPAGAPISASSINIRWSDVQPVKDGPYDWSGLDAAIATSWARGFPVRLRPMLGAEAPAWAMNLGSGPLQFYEVVNNTTDPIPDLWDPTYQAYAQKFIQALAAHISGDHRVRLVFASAAMAKYAEPLVRGVKSNCAEFMRGGYTVAKDMALEKWQLDIMSGFTQQIGMAYNPLLQCHLDGTAFQSQAAMGEIMDHQLSLYGPNTVLQNNELGRLDKQTGTIRPAWYDEFTKRMGEAVIQFQCAAPARLTDEAAAIKWAHDTFGATGVEWAPTLTDAQYAALDTLLKS